MNPAKLAAYLKHLSKKWLIALITAADIIGMVSVLAIGLRPDLHRSFILKLQNSWGIIRNAIRDFPSESPAFHPDSPAAGQNTDFSGAPASDLRRRDHAQKYFPFEKSKRELIKIYRKASPPEPFYCRCPLLFQNGRIYPDIAACGYRIRKQEKRARRIEGEHIVPASWFGGQMTCWKTGGRNNCNNVPEFEIMAGDMHNLTPAVGEVNDDRKAYRYRQFPHPEQSVYGKCQFFISDDKPRAAEPPEYTRGFIARAFKYMERQHGIKLSKGDRQIMDIWDRRYPPDDWECRRNQLVRTVQGNDNPFITAKCP